jgi:hypothetical protein
MPSEGLTPETKLSIALDAICARHRYTADPAAALAELRAAAGARVDVLSEAVGTWIGYFEDDYTRTLTTALRELPGLDAWIAVGQDRRRIGHSTAGFGKPH